MYLDNDHENNLLPKYISSKFSQGRIHGGGNGGNNYPHPFTMKIKAKRRKK